MTRFCTSFVAVMALSTVAAAQSEDSLVRPIDGPTAGLAPVVTPIHAGEPDPVGQPYGIWAAGADYKVSFHGDMTFVPYLGRDYPHNQPWSWRTVDVTVGGSSLDATGGTIERWHDDRRYEYRFAGVVEAYDVLAEGVEQTFVVTQRPASSGPIVVTGQVSSLLVAEPCVPRHGSLTFRDANGLAIVDYGASIAFDAAGEQTEVLTSFDGERITLTVPGAFVERAQFPLTIDPIVGSAVVANSLGTGMLTEADIVRDDRYDRVTVCHARWVSSSDADCWATEWTDNFTSGSGVVLFADLSTLWTTKEIVGAAADSPQRYCFAFSREFTGGTRRIRYHMHDTGDPTLGTSVTAIGSPSIVMDWRLDIGGTTMTLAGDALTIVWQRDLGTTNTAQSRIHAAVVDAQSGSHQVVPVLPTVVFQTVDCERPSINKTEAHLGSGPVNWAVSWQESTGSAWSAAVRKIDDTGAVSGSYVRIYDGVQHLEPKIAGSRGRYAIAYGAASGSQMVGATTRRSAYGLEVQRIDWPHGGAPTVMPARRLVNRATQANREWRSLDLAFDHETASHWLVLYLSDMAGSGDGNVYAARVGYQGFAVESGMVLHDNNAGWTGGVEGGAFYDDDADEFMTALAIHYNPGSGAVAHRIAHAPVTPASSVGISCSPAGIGWIGYGSRQQIGCENSSVRVANAPSQALHFLMVSLASQDVIVQHPAVQIGCRLHVDNITGAYLGLMPIAIGATATWNFPLPEFLDSGTLYFQDWHLDSNGALLQSTSRLEVPIGK